MQETSRRLTRGLSQDLGGSIVRDFLSRSPSRAGAAVILMVLMAGNDEDEMDLLDDWFDYLTQIRETFSINLDQDGPSALRILERFSHSSFLEPDELPFDEWDREHRYVWPGSADLDIARLIADLAAATTVVVAVLDAPQILGIAAGHLEESGAVETPILFEPSALLFSLCEYAARQG